ncbi:MAG: HD domain-containing protein [Candidatus Gastranaerophilales bacterium]|nr:HD domain-containing protein [Candidatus Gastranaerophilales bacterium]
MLSPSKNYRIKNVISDKTRENKMMKRFYLRDLESLEEFKCVIWEDVLSSLDDDAIKNGNIVQVLSSVYKETFKTSTITKLHLIKKAPVGLSKDQREELFQLMIDEVVLFENQSLKEASLTILKEHEELLKVSPAAEKMHHNYVGGLLLHIYECLVFSKQILDKTYQNLDKELITAACITHDLGKMFEYIINAETGEVCRNPEFDKSWISHIHYGFAWANNNNFPELAHIMASHHGRIEWGAIVEPATVEARLFHHIDDLSAYTGRISADEIEGFEITALTK